MHSQDRVSLPLHLHAPLLARMHVHQIGRAWSTELLDDVVLATSELVTNAVLHATGALTLVVHVDAGTVRVEVHDDGDPLEPSAADRPQVPPGSEHGRGLAIVGAVSSRWGVTDRQPPPGKSVWFEVGPAVDAPALRRPEEPPHRAASG